LVNHPRGLLAAAKMAYADTIMGQQMKTQVQTQQLKAEVKDLQKKTLIEGGSKQNIQPVPAHRQAIEKLRQTGSMKDAQAAVRELLRARGIGE
jgi:hypothetical protein